MILGWLRLMVIALVGLTVIYVITSVYSRSVRREKLENQFDAGGHDGDRETFVAEGLKAYDKGLKRKLLWLIYIIPLAAMAVIAWYVNAS